MKQYRQGMDYKSGSLITYGITEIEESNLHSNKIEVFGDPELRDVIVELLNQQGEED